jgi:general secretion pathway protein I
MRSRGFTLIEVLVALGIVAMALMAGVQASGALTLHAQRQSDLMLAQLCAENALVKIRLAQQMPGVGESREACAQGGRDLSVELVVRPTPNPNFSRVDARVWDADTPLWRLTTVVGRY